MSYSCVLSVAALGRNRLLLFHFLAARVVVEDGVQHKADHHAWALSSVKRAASAFPLYILGILELAECVCSDRAPNSTHKTAADCQGGGIMCCLVSTCLVGCGFYQCCDASGLPTICYVTVVFNSASNALEGALTLHDTVCRRRAACTICTLPYHTLNRTLPYPRTGLCCIICHVCVVGGGRRARHALV